MKPFYPKDDRVDLGVLDKALKQVKDRWPGANPSYGLICGSGWSDVVDVFKPRDSMAYDRIPGLGNPGVIGHEGRLVWATNKSGQETFIFQGRRHWYEGEGWTPVAIPIYLLKQLGTSILVVTNAAGGIRKDFKPGHLMLIDDHINLMGSNILSGPRHQVWGPRFPDQSNVYDPQLRLLAEKAAKKAHVNLRHGVYLAVSGPAYETPAEIRAYRILGADAVGMSTAPEAILAHASGLRVIGLSCITNVAAGIAKGPLSHGKVAATTKATMPKIKILLSKLWKELTHA
jgi:purine-nucleoside phosphorylase